MKFIKDIAHPFFHFNKIRKMKRSFVLEIYTTKFFSDHDAILRNDFNIFMSLHAWVGFCCCSFLLVSFQRHLTTSTVIKHLKLSISVTFCLLIAAKVLVPGPTAKPSCATRGGVS